MAGARTKASAIGSASWAQHEREQASQFVDQEVEEFGFSVRNELDWLNEHMAEVFSRNPMNFADVFKTPGKLRGKTPRTVRKRDPLAPRQPLTDIFAPNLPAPQSTHKVTSFDEKVTQFEIAEDGLQRTTQQTYKSRSQSPLRFGKPGNTDSGYHGMTEDEMEADNKTESATESSQQSTSQKVPLRDDQPRPQPLRSDTAETGGVSDDSFVSAKEGSSGDNSVQPAQDRPQESDTDVVMTEVEDVDPITEEPVIDTTSHRTNVSNVPESAHDDPVDEVQHSPSETSSPEKPLPRKSSFTFTALPAREPLTAKRSIGVFNGFTEKSTDGKGIRGSQDDEAQYTQEKPEESKVHNKSSTRSLHERIMMLGKTKEPRASKSIPAVVYPQLTAQENTAAQSQVGTIMPVEDDDDDWIAPAKNASQLSRVATEQPQLIHDPSPNRPGLHQKSISTTNIPSPSRPDVSSNFQHQKAQSISEANLARVADQVVSTTPAGSPANKKQHEAPLSASKSKLYSVLKSAKSIFASSASASAAAKLEAHNSSPSRSPRRDETDESKTAAILNMPGALYSEKQLPASPSRPTSVFSTISRSPSKKSTRSSAESERKKEKERKAQQKVTDDLEKAREQERLNAAETREQKKKQEEAESAATRAEEEALHQEQEQEQAVIDAGQSQSAEDKASLEAEAPAPAPKNLFSSGKLRAPGRIVKPGREAAQSKPVPVSIRMGSQRLAQVSSLKKSQQESTAAPLPPKSTLRTPSTQAGVRGTVASNNSRPKALEAAARKKEADEKQAQKKAEQKRELERKRAAKAEEERRAEEERKAIEQQKAQEAKLAAQRQAEKQAAEAKRREQQRLDQQRQAEQQRLDQQRQAEQQRIEHQRQLEQQRRQEEAEKAKAAHELAEAVKRERAQQAASSHPRGDIGGTIRQLVKNALPDLTSSRPPIQPNPAKPAKRLFQPDEEGGMQQPQQHQPPAPSRPALSRGPPSYQQNEAKRRRTNEEDADDRPSVMAPPKRPSNMRKESTLTKFPLGYTHAPPPQATHHAAVSMFKSSVSSQHHYQNGQKPMPGSHPSQMVQVSNARIPFAENTNPQPAQQYQPHGMHHGGENMQPGHKFKTPLRPAQAPKSAAKSSPLYPNGDSIALPEIATDSEDEESDEDENTGFRAPSWVASPALRDLLTQQQLVDPESVFGPIGELKMDEVFRNGKNQERLKRFRDRGSSAAWVESGDAVTSAEKRRDMELRERVVKDGGWRYDPNI